MGIHTVELVSGALDLMLKEGSVIPSVVVSRGLNEDARLHHAQVKDGSLILQFSVDGDSCDKVVCWAEVEKKQERTYRALLHEIDSQPGLLTDRRDLHNRIKIALQEGAV